MAVRSDVLPGRNRSVAERARSLYLSALDHAARFDEAGMLRDLRAAWAADPSYLPALSEVLSVAEYPYLPAALTAEIDSLAAAQADPGLGRCFRGLLAARLGAWYPMELPPHPSEAARVCAADYRLRAYHRPGEERERAALAWSLWRRFPDSPTYAGLLLGVLASQDRVPVARQMSDRRRPPFVRALGYFIGASTLHDLGRHEEAARWEREADADTKRSGGKVRLDYLEQIDGIHAVLLREAGSDSVVAAHARRVMAAAEEEATALATRAGRAAATGHWLRTADDLLDNGQLAASLSEWDRLASLADSLGEPDLQAHVLVRRGRTLVKLGRPAEAERDLFAGREAARRANDLQWQYEAEHNLLHLYEAIPGRDKEARRAGEAFGELARDGGPPQARQMAHRDLAWFHLRRGERERARLHFEVVVAYTDSLMGYNYWAGEYFELIGDLDRAEAYFQGHASGGAGNRSYAALARLAEATGDLERAVRYARAHDGAAEVAGVPEFAPLLPGVLARHGRVAEAATELARARDRAGRQGQVAAWATLSGEAAALELRRGNLALAAALADSASGAATRVAAVEVEVRARAIAGVARVRMGGAVAVEAVNDMRGVVRRVERMRAPQLEAEILGRYGEALAVSGRTSQALATLGRAADLSDSIAVSLALDPARAGYRAAQGYLSNQALGAILERSAEPQAREWYVAWSVRRKSRGVLERGGARITPSLDRLRRSLAPGNAIIDYAVLDSAVAALVITDRGAVLRRLPVATDTLRAWIGALLSRLAPRIGSQVDTTHAVFDVGLAERLYAVLLAPIETDLAGRTRLSIIADGPLHLLPFDALVVSSKREVVYALDQFTITLAPSLAAVSGRDPPLPSGPVVAVAGSTAVDPDGGMERELETLAAALRPRGVRVLRGPQATEAAVRQYAPAARLLHFAVHARPNDAQPAFARLTLAPEGSDDGLLYAYEIGELRLPGTLVVLSACETGAGRLLGGEGVLSLSRAFLRAGASGTVATLWPVGPATPDLVQVFYSALAHDVPPATALRDAKLALRRGAWSSPFHWASFALVTRDR